MARSDYVERVRSVLYGQGLGEKPSLKACDATASVSVTGAQVSFDLAAGGGASVKPGHILSSINPNDAAKAYAFYVLSVATDTVTAYNGYHGAPSIADSSADLDAAVLEHQPLRTEFEIHEAIDVVFNSMLYPEVTAFEYGAVTPDPRYGQVELFANVRTIDSAWQIIAGYMTQIPFGECRNVPSPISSTGVLGTFDHMDLSTIYFTYLRKLIIGDEDVDPNGSALIQMVATGAAALALDMSVVDTTQERSKKDSQNRRDSDAAARLLRSFFTLKAGWTLEDAQDNVSILVERF